MRFASFHFRSQDRIGLIEENEILLLPEELGDLVCVIEAGERALRQIAELVEKTGLERIAPSDIRLQAPIRRFRRDILCAGWNYWDHFEEGIGRRDGQEVERPGAPTFFTKGPGTVIGPHDDIGFDSRISAKWDYEAELALVIGKTGRSIPRDRALEHVFGFCLANDVSQRDLQRRHGGQWLKGKSIDGTMPLGPVLVTPDEIDCAAIQLRCVLNGVEVQNASTRLMAFSVPELIAELSFGMTLHAGDVLLTGTPAGVGNARTPALFMKAGDEVVVSGTGLGELRNRLVEADLYGASSVPAFGALP
jgi:2,4-didehydro-3-deoxy-L-rhamnonate hydrolase